MKKAKQKSREEQLIESADDFRAKARALEPKEEMKKARQYESHLAVTDSSWCRPALPPGSKRKTS